MSRKKGTQHLQSSARELSARRLADNARVGGHRLGDFININRRINPSARDLQGRASNRHSAKLARRAR